MKGSEFVATYSKKGLAAWEAAVVAMARANQLAIPLLVPVPVEGGGMRGTLLVTGDVVGVGEAGDVVRMPMTPYTAQAVANITGMALLPTRKIVKAAYEAATKRATHHGMVPNKGADLLQYAAHSAIVDSELRALGAEASDMVSGIKKDVVISNLMKPGKVVIYGWIDPNGKAVQDMTNVHGDMYVDYSHGIRLVAPVMTIEGRGEVRTEDVYRDPVLSALVSDEGPLRTPRYPTSSGPPVPFPPSPEGKPSFQDLLTRGLEVIVQLSSPQRKT